MTGPRDAAARGRGTTGGDNTYDALNVSSENTASDVQCTCHTQARRRGLPQRYDRILGRSVPTDVIAPDLAEFVRPPDQHRAMTVVREKDDTDVIGQAHRRVEQLKADAADIDCCTAMRASIERHADGSREGQKRGILAAVRLDERGHRGLAAALAELLSVRAKDPRDFWSLVTWANRIVLGKPSGAEDIGCRCHGSTEIIRRRPAILRRKLRHMTDFQNRPLRHRRKLGTP